MKSFTPEVEDTVRDTITAIYQTLAERFGIPESEVPTWGVCRKVTIPLRLVLRDFFDPRMINKDERLAWTGDTHCYTSIVDGDDEVIIEGAWQQFVPARLRSPDLTPVLIGTRDQIIHTAALAGVWECDQELWLPKGEYHNPREVMSGHPSARLL